MAVNDVFEMAVEYNLGPETIVNVWHYRQTSEIVQKSRTQQISDLADRMIQDINNFQMNWMNTTVTQTVIRGFCLNDPTSFAVVPNNQAGAFVGQVLPLRSAAVVKKLTSSRGRSYRGRIFIGPLNELQQDAGGLTPTAEADIQTFVDNMRLLADIDGNILRTTVYSRKLSTPPTTIIDNLVETYFVNVILGTQRSRQSVN